jgi:gliding motility-associated-like protein
MKHFYLNVFFLLVFSAAFAQAPVITYSTPQTYTTNNTIAPLAPVNTGGAVPATIYGQVSTFAGSGFAGSADGTGTAASFNSPTRSAFDANGNLFVVDRDNNRIRKITPAGVVSTVSSTGFNGPNGICVDASGNLYVADATSNSIKEVSTTGVVTTLATGFHYPYSIINDAAGNLYVADTYNNEIKQITPTSVVSILAGTGAAGGTDGPGASATFNLPNCVKIDAAKNIYVADADNFKIRVVSAAGIVTTYAGTGVAGATNGPAATATFALPTGVEIDQTTKNVYVADLYNNMIRKIDPFGNVSTLAGSGVAGSVNGVGTAASFYHPNDMTFTPGFLYVTDYGNNLIRKIILTGYTIDKALPAGLVFDPTTGIITGTPTAVSPATNYTITAYNIYGSSSFVVNIGVTATPVQPPNISYQTPQVYSNNVAISPLAPTNSGGAVPATIYGQTTAFVGSGNAGNSNGIGTAASFYAPYGSGIDASGNVYVADTYNQLIRKITPAGLVSTFAGTGSAGYSDGPGSSAQFNNPGGLAVDAAGNIFVGDQTNNVIRKITPAGVVSTFAGNGTAGATNGTGTSASFNLPAGVAFDAQGNLYVAERNNNIIRKITPAGVVSTFAGSGAVGSANGTGIAASFNGPSGVAVDASGNVFVADQYNYLIRKITAAGVVTTLAGSGLLGATNGLATSASFNKPFGVAVDQAGNVYVADEFNQIVREITPAGYVNTLAGSGAIGGVNGIGTNASFYYPAGLVSDGNGTLYVTETGGDRIRKLITTGYVIDKALPAGLAFSPATGIISGTPTTTSPATNYTVTAYNAAGASTTVVNIAVAGLPQILTFTPISSVTYGHADITPPATSNNSSIPVTFTSSNPAVATISTSGQIHIVGVGSVTITANQAANSTYGAAAPVSQTFTVSPATVNIALTNQTKVYGTANPAPVFTYTGFVNGETLAVVTTLPSVTTSIAASTPVGNYVLSIGGAVSPNYVFTYASGILAITPALLNIKVNDAARVYGAANPAFTLTYTGFITGDDATSLTTQANITTLAIVASGVGTYPVTATGAIDANYTITYSPGTLTVTPATLTIKPNDVTRAYGVANPALALTYTGFVAGDDVTKLITLPSISTGVTINTSVGTYPITAFGAAVANYAITYVPGVLTIIPVPLTITAVNATRVYGSPNPAFTATYVGFVLGDDPTKLNPQVSITTTATINSPVGTYPINVSAGVDPNYTITFTPGTLTITPAPLNIQANNVTRVYGSPNPPFTATYVGFVAGDDATKLTTQATISTPATITSPVGTSPINVSAAVDANYTITYTAGTLTITPANLAIKANNATRIYGVANPIFTATYTGFVAGDDATKLTVQPGFTTTATIASNIGTYPITASGAVDANYNITYTGGTLTINIAPRILTFSSLPIKGTNDPDFDPGATINTNDPIIYTSADPYIAIIVNNKVHILRPGTVAITATVAPRANYADVPSQTQLLSILSDPAELVVIHPVVTPNGDGINDVLLIDAITNYPDNNITIVNVNGTRVYESGGYDNVNNTFDGHSNLTGTFLPQGTYFYSLRFKVNGDFKKKVGFFVLKY